MKTSLIPSVLLALTTITAAQELVPLEEAQNVARVVTYVLGKPADVPFASDVDVEKPHAAKSDQFGLMIIPERTLSEDTLKSVGKEPVPVGQLWTMKLSVAKDRKPTANDQLRFVEIDDGERKHRPQIYFVGAARNAEGALELQVFGKGKEPLVRVPLTSAAEPRKQEFPIELAGQRDDDTTGTLKLHVLGKYTAALTVSKQAE